MAQSFCRIRVNTVIPQKNSFKSVWSLKEFIRLKMASKTSFVAQLIDLLLTKEEKR